ncbi:hypothetical protein ABH926_004860, partial [Catenulispora sp. GP43]|uniref:hypothetical protein n=1 Tax=Catenulispora sp. GP43 TaxID=3156263 RepID=UPI003513DA59
GHVLGDHGHPQSGPLGVAGRQAMHPVQGPQRRGSLISPVATAAIEPVTIQAVTIRALAIQTAADRQLGGGLAGSISLVRQTHGDDRDSAGRRAAGRSGTGTEPRARARLISQRARLDLTFRRAGGGRAR